MPDFATTLGIIIALVALWFTYEQASDKIKGRIFGIMYGPVFRRLHEVDKKASDDLNFHRFLRAVHRPPEGASWKLLSVSQDGKDTDPFPCAIFEVPDGQMDKPESAFLVSEPLAEMNLGATVEARKFERMGQGYRQNIERVARYGKLRSDNGLGLAQRRIVRNPGSGYVSIEIGLSGYLDSVQTCDSLKFEAQRSWVGGLAGKFEADASKAQLLAQCRKHLPMRHLLVSQVNDPVADGTWRCPRIGLSTLICYQDKDSGYRVLVKRRSQAKLAIDAGRIHVIPSGMMEDFPERRDKLVMKNFCREYAEELFGAEVTSTSPAANRFKAVFRQIEESGDAALFLTGIAVNLLNLRPEICTLLILRGPSNYEAISEISGSPEFDANPERQTTFYRKVQTPDDRQMLRKEEDWRPHKMVPPGAATLWLGLEALENRKPVRDFATGIK